MKPAHQPGDMLLHDLRRGDQHLVVIERHLGFRRGRGKRGADIHAHQHVALLAVHAVQRQRVDRTAVDQHLPVAVHGLEDRRDRDRSPDGVVQPAAVQHHFAPREQIGRHGRERHGHPLDLHIRNQLLHGIHHTVALDQPLGAQGEVHQTENLVFVEFAQPLLERFEMPRGIDAPDQRAHRRTGDGADLETLTFQLFDSSDMGHSPRPAAGQHQRHFSFLHKIHSFIRSRTSFQTRAPHA